jgi:Family of unknown function (DUF6886)
MSVIKLFHVSGRGDIALFVPRPVPSPDAGVEGEAVWAIDEAHLPNYLLPRDCPRVTFRAAGRTTAGDRAKFLTGTKAARVIAVEARWLPAIRSDSLFLYRFSPDAFALTDKGAGYYISRRAVAPLSVARLDDLLTELLQRNIELRILPDLWALRDAVSASTLEFSIIRFRNAAPRA